MTVPRSFSKLGSAASGLALLPRRSLVSQAPQGIKTTNGTSWLLYPDAEILATSCPTMGRSSKLNSPLDLVSIRFCRTSFFWWVFGSTVAFNNNTLAWSMGFPEESATFP